MYPLPHSMEHTVKSVELSAERSVYYIRHGESSEQSHSWDGIPRYDDPLSEEGCKQADAAEETLAGVDFDFVMVSPLTRTLETAARIFGRRPNVLMYVNPDITEFRFDQREDQPLKPRYIGKTFRELKKEFPQENFVWPEEIEEDGAWWEPHGDCFIDHSSIDNLSKVPTCTERLHRFINHRLDGDTSWRNIAIVGHANVYKLLTGALAIKHATPTPLRLLPPSPHRGLTCFVIEAMRQVIHRNAHCVHIGEDTIGLDKKISRAMTSFASVEGGSDVFLILCDEEYHVVKTREIVKRYGDLLVKAC